MNEKPLNSSSSPPSASSSAVPSSPGSLDDSSGMPPGGGGDFARPPERKPTARHIPWRVASAPTDDITVSAPTQPPGLARSRSSILFTSSLY